MIGTYPYPQTRQRTGMGATGTQTAGAVTGAAATIAGSNAAAIAGTLGVAVPVVGIAIAGIALAVSVWLNRMGPKQKRWTTQIADEATAQLRDVKRVYFESPYSPANQAAALGAVDALFDAIREGCGQTQMGEPGRRCIAERLVRGGSAPWCPTGTGCDYFTEYRDPIANDARAGEWVGAQVTAGTLHPDGTPLTLTEQVGAAAEGITSQPWFPFIVAGIVALVVVNTLGDS